MRVTKSISPKFRSAQGREYEKKAQAIFLEQNPGAILVAQNFKKRGFEVDLIFETVDRAMLDHELVFVEVRMRSGMDVSPEDTIHEGKRRRIQRGAAYFLARYQGRAQSIRFSVITFSPRGVCYWPRAWG